MSKKEEIQELEKEGQIGALFSVIIKSRGTKGIAFTSVKKDVGRESLQASSARKGEDQWEEKSNH